MTKEIKIVKVKCSHCNRIHLYKAEVEMITYAMRSRPPREEMPDTMTAIRIFTCPITKNRIQVPVTINIPQNRDIDEITMVVLSTETSDDE